MLEKFYKENPGKLLNGKVYNAKRRQHTEQSSSCTHEKRN